MGIEAVDLRVATIEDVRNARKIIRQHISSVPLLRSYALEQELNFAEDRRVWLQDYGWTPVGSFKLMGALNWMAMKSSPFSTTITRKSFVTSKSLPTAISETAFLMPP